jgi:hypothetical protein
MNCTTLASLTDYVLDLHSKQLVTPEMISSVFAMLSKIADNHI